MHFTFTFAWLNSSSFLFVHLKQISVDNKRCNGVYWQRRFSLRLFPDHLNTVPCYYVWVHYWGPCGLSSNKLILRVKCLLDLPGGRKTIEYIKSISWYWAEPRPVLQNPYLSYLKVYCSGQRGVECGLGGIIETRFNCTQLTITYKSLSHTACKHSLQAL